MRSRVQPGSKYSPIRRSGSMRSRKPVGRPQIGQGGPVGCGVWSVTVGFCGPGSAWLNCSASTVFEASINCRMCSRCSKKDPSDTGRECRSSIRIAALAVRPGIRCHEATGTAPTAGAEGAAVSILRRELSLGFAFDLTNSPDGRPTAGTVSRHGS